MNERIKQLAIEANLISQESNGFDPTRLSIAQQKFAELIVKECCNILDPGEHQLIARFQARKWLQEHFGVEE
jgi:hypothetical protein